MSDDRPDRFALSGKAALVTGGASGLGRATSEALAAAGADVMVVDLDEEGARETAETIGGERFIADVARLEDNVAAVAAARDAFGRLDIVHLNAGVASGFSVGAGFDIERYRRLIGVNIDGVVLGTHAALELLERDGGGVVVATASLGGLTPFPFDPIYSATKHAVVGLARSLGPALSERGVRFNAVCPAFAESKLTEDLEAPLAESGLQLIPARQVADAVLELVRGDMTGECWFVQSGRQSARFDFRGAPGPRPVAA